MSAEMSTKVFKCGVCDRLFMSVKEGIQHVRTSHGSSGDTSPNELIENATINKHDINDTPRTSHTTKRVHAASIDQMAKQLLQ